MAYLRSSTAGNVVPSEPLTHRNLIINGGMQVAHRSASIASITNDGYYTLDRFKIFNDTQGTFTMSQSTTAPTDQGFSSSLKMDCTTADASPAAADRVGIRQYFEGQDIQNFKDNPKLKLLLETLEGIPENRKVIIWAVFHNEVYNNVND